LKILMVFKLNTPSFVNEAYWFSGRFRNEPLLEATTHAVFSAKQLQHKHALLTKDGGGVLILKALRLFNLNTCCMVYEDRWCIQKMLTC